MKSKNKTNSISWSRGRKLRRGKQPPVERASLQAVSLVKPGCPSAKGCEGTVREEASFRWDLVDSGLSLRERSGTIGGVGEKWERGTKEGTSRVSWGRGH